MTPKTVPSWSHSFETVSDPMARPPDGGRSLPERAARRWLGAGATVLFLLAGCGTAPPAPRPPLPNDASSNQTPFEAVRIPQAWELMRGHWQHDSKFDHRWPGVVVVDDGFFAHGDLPIRPGLAPAFPSGTSEGKHTSQLNYGEHGTGVLSLIAATVDNRGGIAGVAGPRRDATGKLVGGCWPIPARAVGFLPSGGGMHPTSLAAAIEHWLQHHHVRIFNVSQSVIELNNGSSLAPAFRKARARGALIVIGAGNDKAVRNQRGSGGWLKEFDNVLIVGGLDHQGTALWEDPTEGTATGSAVDVYAPAQDLTVISTETKLDKVDGTSYATPMVSGVAAMMLNARPELRPARIRKLIMDTADPLSITGHSNVRRLNAEKAVLAALRPPVARFP